MIKIKKSYILNFYLFLFVFTMINREFLPFGIDLRYILMSVGFILLIYGFIKKVYKNNCYYDSSIKFIIMLYIWIFLSNISWIWNGLEINNEKFINEMILLINILISIINFWQYRDKIDYNFMHKSIIFSCFVLSLSMILVSCGFTANQIFMSTDVSYIYDLNNEYASNKNIYGMNFRSAGYASDPNYASILLLMGIVSCLKINESKLKKVIIIFYFLLVTGLAFSKTIMAACIFAIFYVFVINHFIKNKNIIQILNFSLIVAIISLNFLLPYIGIVSPIPNTLKTRFSMWNRAYELFIRSPIIGNGITSFRSYYSIMNWYVQCHSTYWQILSETGIIGIILLFIVLKKLLNNSINNKYNCFFIIVFIIFMVDFETIALQFIVYFLILNQIDNNKKKITEKKALFMVNSLSNGGAERVCINMANELCSRNYKVDFIILGNNNSNTISYDIDENIKILNLNINTTNKIKKLFLLLGATVKVNDYILNQEKNGKYSLITSHLPMSNFLTMFSIVKNRAIYVFHTTVDMYFDKENFVMSFLFKLLFKNKKVVAVSNGVRDECINNFGFYQNNIITIYNPIELSKIEEKMNESIDFNYKYFLAVGRFNQAKRYDRIIDVFYNGKFYKKYRLLLCGVGELENEIKEKVKKLNIEDRVIFLGWQNNSYKWMKNAEILISASDHEAFPMTLIEAFACGTKVVAADCNYGPNEILKGDYSKYLVKKDDIADYIKKIKLALKEYPSSYNSVLRQCNSSIVIDKYLKFMNKVG